MFVGRYRLLLMGFPRGTRLGCCHRLGGTFVCGVTCRACCVSVYYKSL